MVARSDSKASGDHHLVEIRAASVGFGRQPVLRDITIEIPRGETLVVIGESGCGKTVLLKSMIGLVRPQQGDVLFDGRDLSELRQRELAQQRTRCGFLFQSAALFDSMTVAQNISFPLREHTKKSKSEIAEIVADRIADVGLPEAVLNQKPVQLSGGMRKRVGLARAMVMNPDLMLYDEPTTGLDPIMSDVINELILRNRQRYDVTSVVVTHDMRTARKVADRIVMLYPLGRLDADEPQKIFDGPPEAIETSGDARVTQFVEGEAGERLMEMRQRGR